MRIGNLNLKGKALLAPLAGVSNRPFRVLARKAGAAMTFTEMISSEGVIRNQHKTMTMMEFGSEEKPIGIQLFGAKPNVLGQASKIALEKYNPDIIDLNFGCPVKKVVNKNGGAALLKDLGLAREIVVACVEVCGDIPVTVKIRTGWDEEKPVYLEAGRTFEEAGAKAVTLHARSRSKGYSGQADWSAIKKLKETIGIPLIGNGDVNSPLDARRMLDETGCDAVMIGRAALGHPFIFMEVNHFLETGKLLPEPGVENKFEMARLHAKLIVEQYGEMIGMKMMRKYLGWYIKGFRGAVKLKPRLFQVEKLDDMESIFNDYLVNHEQVSRRSI